jgi:hypothetical protein
LCGNNHCNNYLLISNRCGREITLTSFNNFILYLLLIVYKSFWANSLRILNAIPHVERIRWPTLVCAGESDEIGVTAQKLYDTLTCEKSFIAFVVGDGARAHCEAGPRALFNQRAFDWLDTVLGR